MQEDRVLRGKKRGKGAMKLVIITRKSSRGKGKE
jgi:hypothetical protein